MPTPTKSLPARLPSPSPDPLAGGASLQPDQSAQQHSQGLAQMRERRGELRRFIDIMEGQRGQPDSDRAHHHAGELRAEAAELNQRIFHTEMATRSFEDPDFAKFMQRHDARLRNACPNPPPHTSKPGSD